RPGASTAGAGSTTVGSTHRTASSCTRRGFAQRIPGAAAPASPRLGAAPDRFARSLELAESGPPAGRACGPAPPGLRRPGPRPLASPARPSWPDPPPTTPRPDSHRRYWLHPGTPAPAPICVAEFLVSFAWTVFPWPSALLTEAVWPARPSSVTSFRPSPSAASPFSPASRTPSPAFTMAALAVHDGPIFAFTMTDLAVHDGPIFAFTMVRNSHLRHSNVKTTTTVYGHLLPDYLRSEIDRLTFYSGVSKSGHADSSALLPVAPDAKKFGAHLLPGSESGPPGLPPGGGISEEFHNVGLAGWTGLE